VCGRLNGGCHSQANCTITTTGRVCACKAGFTGSGLTCTGERAWHASPGCTVSEMSKKGLCMRSSAEAIHANLLMLMQLQA